MKKQILNIGKALNRAEQKEVFGGLVQYAGNCSGENKHSMGKGCSCLRKSASDCASGICEYDGHVFGNCA